MLTDFAACAAILTSRPTAATRLSQPNRTRLRKALEVRAGLFVESNLSANGIRYILRRVLTAFAFPSDQLLIFLRQDRDAGRPDDAA